MKIAIATDGSNVSPYFGHCRHYTIFEVDESKKQVLGQTAVTTPAQFRGYGPRQGGRQYHHHGAHGLGRVYGHGNGRGPGSGDGHGRIAQFLKDQEVSCVITGGMGMRAFQAFQAADINPIVGAGGSLDEAIGDFLEGKLENKNNLYSYTGRGYGQGYGRGCGRGYGRSHG